MFAILELPVNTMNHNVPKSLRDANNNNNFFAADDAKDSALLNVFMDSDHGFSEQASLSCVANFSQHNKTNGSVPVLEEPASRTATNHGWNGHNVGRSNSTSNSNDDSERLLLSSSNMIMVNHFEAESQQGSNSEMRRMSTEDVDCLLDVMFWDEEKEDIGMDSTFNISNHHDDSTIETRMNMGPNQNAQTTGPQPDIGSSLNLKKQLVTGGRSLSKKRPSFENIQTHKCQKKPKSTSSSSSPVTASTNGTESEDSFRKGKWDQREEILLAHIVFCFCSRELKDIAHIAYSCGLNRSARSIDKKTRRILNYDKWRERDCEKVRRALAGVMIKCGWVEICDTDKKLLEQCRKHLHEKDAVTSFEPFWYHQNMYTKN